MAPAASSLTCGLLRPSPLLFLLASCLLLLSRAGPADAGSPTQNCSTSGDACQEGGPRIHPAQHPRNANEL